MPEMEEIVKRSGISREMNRKRMGTALRAGATLLLSLFLCFAMEDAASAKGKAYVAVFYRTFKDEEDPEAAEVRAALNEALEDAGIVYREYDGEDDPLIQLMQIVQEKDAMLLIVNPAEQSLGGAGQKAGEETEKNAVADTEADVTADIIVQTDGRPLIFFDCEIRKETEEMTEELCVLVNAEEPETETAGSETEANTEKETEKGIEAETKNETETENGIETETETKTESESPKKNIQGMADAIAIIAGNYMTGAGFFEGIEEDWLTDDWRVDVPCRF